MLTIEALAGMTWRLLAGVLGDLFDARYLLMFALIALVIGMVALSVAHDYVSLIIFAVGAGIGTTVTPLAVMVFRCPDTMVASTTWRYSRRSVW